MADFFHLLFTWDGLVYFFILSLLEIVLGIDNIIFISIVTDNLENQQKRKARNLGLTLALVARLVLLALVSWIMSMHGTLFTVFKQDISGQDLVLLGGGLFLIYKSTVEMHNSVAAAKDEKRAQKNSLRGVIMQIVMIDIVFSFDSIISAIGMTNGVGQSTGYSPLVIIYAAVVVSMIVMMMFAKPIGDFINNRPTIKMIALGFLVTIGVILVAEAFDQHIPKGYIYFAMVYSLIVEMLNIRMRRNISKKEEDVS